MGHIQEVKDAGGTVKVSVDRRKIPNPDPNKPRFGVRVTVYSLDLWGDGESKEAATTNALQQLPPNLQRHFSVPQR